MAFELRERSAEALRDLSGPALSISRPGFSPSGTERSMDLSTPGAEPADGGGS